MSGVLRVGMVLFGLLMLLIGYKNLSTRASSPNFLSRSTRVVGGVEMVVGLASISYAFVA